MKLRQIDDLWIIENIIMPITILVFIGLIVLAVFSLKATCKRIDECKSRGGVWLHREMVCAKSTNFIPLERR